MFIHSGRQKRFSQGSVNPVLQRASSLLFDSIEDKNTLLNVEQKANYFMAEEDANTFCFTRFNVRNGGGRLLSLSLWYSSSN